TTIQRGGRTMDDKELKLKCLELAFRVTKKDLSEIEEEQKSLNQLFKSHSSKEIVFSVADIIYEYISK
ncbi:MAG TPA: hypothetical protein PK771_13970, partial [Spirochaetota bacterium]|nr:hypothetical protein [Spirochaetota bacterium]